MSQEDSEPQKKLEVSRAGMGPPPRKIALGQDEEPDEEPDESQVFQGSTIVAIYLKRCFLLAKAFILACLGRSQSDQ